MVTTPTASGGVGGRLRVRSVRQRKTPQAKENAAIQRSAEEICPDSERSREPRPFVMRAESTRVPPATGRLFGRSVTAHVGAAATRRQYSRPQAGGTLGVSTRGASPPAWPGHPERPRRASARPPTWPARAAAED